MILETKLFDTTQIRVEWLIRCWFVTAQGQNLNLDYNQILCFRLNIRETQAVLQALTDIKCIYHENEMLSTIILGSSTKFLYAESWNPSTI